MKRFWDGLISLLGKSAHAIGALVVLICAMYVSFQHSIALFVNGAGLPQHHAIVIVVAIEVVFVMSAAVIMVKRMKGLQLPTYTVCGGIFGVLVVTWGNVRVSLDYGIEGILLGLAVPISVILAEGIFAEAVRRPDTSDKTTNDAISPATTGEITTTNYTKSPAQEVAITTPGEEKSPTESPAENDKIASQKTVEITSSEGGEKASEITNEIDGKTPAETGGEPGEITSKDTGENDKVTSRETSNAPTDPAEKSPAISPEKSPTEKTDKVGEIATQDASETTSQKGGESPIESPAKSPVTTTENTGENGGEIASASKEKSPAKNNVVSLAKRTSKNSKEEKMIKFAIDYFKENNDYVGRPTLMKRFGVTDYKAKKVVSQVKEIIEQDLEQKKAGATN